MTVKFCDMCGKTAVLSPRYICVRCMVDVATLVFEVEQYLMVVILDE